MAVLIWLLDLYPEMTKSVRFNPKQYLEMPLGVALDLNLLTDEFLFQVNSKTDCTGLLPVKKQPV